jgi:hypothetical protein
MSLLLNELKDEIFRIELSENELIFTRYLYIKDEVKIALLLALLDKKEDAVFWAYELYMSGFKQETFEYIWQIYYDFYATLNPTFEEYFIKKHTEWITNECKNNFILGIIIKNLLVRPSNTDIFMLRNICDQFEIAVNYKDKNYFEHNISYDILFENIRYWIENEDYRSLAQTILYYNSNPNNKLNYNYTLLYTDCLHIVENMKILPDLKKNNLIRSFMFSLKVPIKPEIILLAKIMQLCTRIKGIKQSKSKYLNIDENEFIPICETLITNNNDKKYIKSYRCLKNAYICGINEVQMLNLFKLVRNKYNENNLKKEWFHHWEYYASFSPIWFERIKTFSGEIDYSNKKIRFLDEELMEEFYSKYGYEPDEQPRYIQDKVIGLIKNNKNNWIQFQKIYKNGIFEPYEEELEEFCI